jgi:ATP-dependent RNA helicase DDX3X
MAPTRELAIQIHSETQKFTAPTELRTVCIYGGGSMGEQRSQLRYPCQILIATPGRLIDMLGQRALTLRTMEFLVLDEADRMLDLGFGPQIRQVITEFDMPPAESRQTLLFSATFPREVESLAEEFMRVDVTRIEVGLQDAPSLIEQRFQYCKDGSKFSALLELLSDISGQTLVFAERKRTVDQIEDYLHDEGSSVVGIHGDRDMHTRLAALRAFTSGQAQIMVATDVAARGIDIPSVAHVINVDLPTDLDSYIHRIGRTGRAGRKGIAISFWNEGNGQFLAQLCQHFRRHNQGIPHELEEYAGGGFRTGGQWRGRRMPTPVSYAPVSYRR